MKKNLLFGIMMVLVLALFVGCSNDGANNASEEKVTLSLATSIYNEAPHKAAIDKLIEMYKTEKPDVTIKIQGADFENFEDKLMTEVIAGNEADIIQFYPQSIATFHNLVEDGTFVNLDEFISESNLEEKLVGQELTKLDDSYYGLSNYAWGNTGIFYRKSAFEQAGINPEDISTLEDFKNAAEALGVEGDNPGKMERYGFASVVSSHPFIASEWFRLVARPVSQGVFFSDGEQGPYTAERINFNSKENIWAAEWWQDFLNNPKITTPGTVDKKVAREMFWNGDAAMVMDGPWFIGMTSERDEELIEDLGLIPQPNIEYEGELYKSNPFNNPLVTTITKNSKHQEEAWEFMEWMTSPEAQEVIAGSGMIPSSKEFTETEEYKENNELAYQFVTYETDLYETPLMDPAIPEQGELFRLIIDATEEMFISNKDATEIMNKTAKEMEDVMNK